MPTWTSSRRRAAVTRCIRERRSSIAYTGAFVAVALIAGCSDSPDSPPPASTVTISGVVADGPLQGVALCYDLNNNGATNAFDTPLFRAQLGQPSIGPTFNKADLNCNGSVNSFDTPLFRSLLGAPPGPSGLVP